MQEISAFYGMSVRMGYSAGKEANFRVNYEDSEKSYSADFSINTLDVISGEFPPTGKEIIQEWGKPHREELIRNWHLAKEGKPLVAIKPIDDECCGRTPKWVVASVEPRTDHTLLLTFADGKRGIYGVRPLLSYKAFEPLKNTDFFMLAHIGCGTVVWNDDIDLDPEGLYMDSKPITEA